MNENNKKIMKRLTLATFALIVCGATLFALDVSSSIFNGIFEIGPGVVTDEGGLTNIPGNTTNAGPDWADIMKSTGSTKPGGDDRSPATPRGFFDTSNANGGEGAFITDDASAAG